MDYSTIRSTDITSEYLTAIKKDPSLVNRVIAYDSAAHLQGFNNSFFCTLTFREDEPTDSSGITEITDGTTTMRVTTPLQTFCDMLNRYEFVTGHQYEICCNIYEYYSYPPNNLGGTEELYRLAQLQVPQKILDDNWDELKDFYANQ